MVGVIPSEVEMYPQPQGHGYVIAEVTEENPWLPAGLTVRGHQFHHSRLSNPDGLKFAYHMKRRRENDPEADGIVYKNVFAAYTHLHALGVPQWAKSFTSLASQNQKTRAAVNT
jgi:cobyrinic acid a,c-diamide synthase